MSSMRELIESTVAANWVAGLDEGLHPACYAAGWTCRDEDYGASWHISPAGSVVLRCVDDPGLRGVLATLPDEALLAFLDGQLCLKYR